MGIKLYYIGLGPDEATKIQRSKDNHVFYSGVNKVPYLRNNIVKKIHYT